VAKIWETKSGNATIELRHHTKRCYWATFDSAGTHVITCGSDRMVLYWDVRKSKTPVYVNQTSESTVLSCDFFPGDNNLVATTMEGEVFIMAVNEDLRTIKHESL